MLLGMRGKGCRAVHRMPVNIKPYFSAVPSTETAITACSGTFVSTRSPSLSHVGGSSRLMGGA